MRVTILHESLMRVTILHEGLMRDSMRAALCCGLKLFDKLAEIELNNYQCIVEY